MADPFICCSLSMHLMAQPDVASMMLNDPLIMGQGILSRNLLTAPESTSGHRPWHEPSDKSERAMKRYGARLLTSLSCPYRFCQMGRRSPHVRFFCHLRLDPCGASNISLSSCDLHSKLA